jgi:hypothetical protein
MAFAFSFAIDARRRTLSPHYADVFAIISPRLLISFSAADMPFSIAAGWLPPLRHIDYCWPLMPPATPFRQPAAFAISRHAMPAGFHADIAIFERHISSFRHITPPDYYRFR